MSSSSPTPPLRIGKIKMIYIRAKHQTGEYTELKDIANQIAQLFYNQPNYESCLGKAQNIYKNNNNLSKKIFKVIWPERKILKVKCRNRKNNSSENCKCSIYSTYTSDKKINWQCAKLRADISNMIRHISNNDIDIS